jgi:hypothetical protein
VQGRQTNRGPPFICSSDPIPLPAAPDKESTAMTNLKPPIFLFGNHRSGTTITQKVIGLSPAIATWYEPRTMWRYADPGRQHDEFDENDATEKVIRYIRSQFLKYQSDHGGRQVMENTPSNTLRVPYVNAIFPEAIYLYITRNPFSSISSMEFKWHRVKTWAGLRRSLANTPATQLHHYAGEFLMNVIVKRLLKKKDIAIWGPRYRGIDQDLRDLGKMTVIARQWARGNRKAREDLASLGKDRVLTFRYEDLISDPETLVQRIYNHCGLAWDDGILRAAKDMVDPGRQEKWRRLDAKDLRAILPELREEMAVYGYEIPAPLR